MYGKDSGLILNIDLLLNSVHVDKIKITQSQTRFGAGKVDPRVLRTQPHCVDMDGGTYITLVDIRTAVILEDNFLLSYSEEYHCISIQKNAVFV